MTLTEYQQIIGATTDADWTRISCWGAFSGPSFLNKFVVWTKGRDEFSNLEVESHSEVMSLKTNLLVSVAIGLKHNDDFREPWANQFADPHAMSSFVDFFYSGVLVFRDIYVAVDGGRCLLPLPDRHPADVKDGPERLTAPSAKIVFYRLLNSQGGAQILTITYAEAELKPSNRSG